MMDRHLTYRPQPAQIPADSLRGGSCDTRDPRRFPCDPWRHVSPAHPILNSSFLILNWSYTFSAKEKDTETGYSYFGARYYSSDLSIWLSVDPQAAKYPSLSPYTYCANNPVKLVDPNGEEVYIKGEASEEATSQLQATTKNLVITRNEETGKLSVEGKPKGRNERLLYRAIKSECVKVNIDAEYANKNKEGNYDVDGDPAVGSKGGSFMGNVIVKLNNSKKYVVTSQKVFPEALCEDFDDNGKYYGESIRHEVTESFIGGLISLRRGRPAPAAIFDKKIYNIAHRRATPQPSEETSSNEANEAITPGYKPYQRIYY